MSRKQRNSIRISRRPNGLRFKGLQSDTRRRLLFEQLEVRTMLAADVFAPMAEESAFVAEGESQAEGESRALANLTDFAVALDEAGVVFFGSHACVACARQKALFGDGADSLPHVEVTNPDGSLNQIGIDNNITSTPTWDFPDGTRLLGFLTLTELSAASGIPLPTNIVALVTNGGPVELETLAGNAPGTVENFLNYVNDGDYDNSIFHRLVPGFIIQAGGFSTTSETLTSTNQLSSIPTDPPITNEFDVSNTRGTVAMAKLGGQPNSATSQLFVNLGNNAQNLDNQNGGFSVFAIIRDMAVVDQLAQTPTGNYGGVFSDLPVSATDQLVVIRSAEGSGEVRGIAFEDADTDGVRDGGEAAIANLTAFIDANDNGVFDSGELSATTDANGNYSIVVGSGDHIVRFALGANETSTTGLAARHAVSVEIGRTTTQDLGRFTVGDVAAIDLSSAYDTGSSDSDELTNLDNSIVANALEFVVTGAASGAIVRVFAGNQLLGQATASSPATILTSGDFELDGSTVITAEQEVAGVTGPRNTSLTIDIDDTPPTFTSVPPTAVKVAELLSYDANTQDVSDTFALVNAPAGATIDGATGAFTWTPIAAQVGVHAFEIAATDTAGNEVRQSLSVDVLSNDQIIVRLDVTDLAGNPITEIDAGESFLVRGFASDNRLAPQGVTQVYFDLIYQNNLVLADGPITYGASFPNAQTGDSSQIGLVDELGAAGNSMVVNGAELLLFEAPFLANVGGVETFGGEPADIFPASNSLLIGDANPVSPDVIRVEGDTLTVNLAFGANGDLVGIDEDSVDVSIDVLANDQKFQGSNAELTISAVGASGQGATVQIAGDAKSLIYTPQADFVGVDTFTYTVTDGVGFDTATVVVNVLDVNDPPTAVDDTFQLTEDAAETLLDVVQNDLTTPDVGETLLITSVSAPDRGGQATLGGAGSFVLYTPSADTNGVELFTYTVRDNRGLESEGTVTVNLAPVNDPPTAVGDNFNLSEDDAAAIFRPLGNDSFDPDENETLTITNVTEPVSGTVAIVDNGTGIEFTPAADFEGPVFVTYTISDGNGGESSATILFRVADVNDPPTAVDDAATVTKNTSMNPIDVLANDSFSPDTEEVLSVSGVVSSANGTAAVSGDGLSILYTPNQGFVGEDTVTYTLADGRGGEAMATVVITVRDFEPSMLGGSVFVDRNDNGRRDFGETPIGGVTIDLSGVDDFGDAVDLSTTTDADGNYEFASLAPGDYSIIERQPGHLLDGPDYVGTQGGSLPANDIISASLAEGVEGLANNFTELGRTVQFVRLSDFFLRPAVPQAELYEDTQTGLQTFALGAGWENVTGVVLASPDNGDGAAVLNVTTSHGDVETVTLPYDQLETRVAGSQVYRRITASVAQLGVDTSCTCGALGEGELASQQQQASQQQPAISQPVIESQPIQVLNTAAPQPEGESLPAGTRQFSNVEELARSTRLSTDATLAAWPSELQRETIAEDALAQREDPYAESLDGILADEIDDILLDELN